MENAERILIYIVDKDLAYLEKLREDLDNEYRFVIKTFTSGEECLEQLYHKPDIVIMEYYLKGINGIETLKKIKAFKGSERIAVILMSAQEDIKITLQAFNNKVYDYVNKGEHAVDRIRHKVNNIVDTLHHRKSYFEVNLKINRYQLLFIGIFFIMFMLAMLTIITTFIVK